jgi:hypothetical protein
MNGKFEEKLAQLAFEDMTSEEAARIEAQAGSNPAALQALAEFRDMREGLRGLAEVPEHQLSNERLRDAILARGLHPEPVKDSARGFGAGWLWMPVAALSLGFGLMMLRPHKAADATVVMPGDNVTASRFDISLPEPNDLFKPREFAPMAKNESSPKEEARPSMTLASSKQTDSKSRVAHRSRRHNPMFTDDYKPIKVSWKAPEVVAGNKADKPNPKPPTEAPKETYVASKTDNSPIVLIDTNPDAATGAPTATEVGTASNVLIGG